MTNNEDQTNGGLAALRAEIDRIDDLLVDLIEQRLAAAHAVAQHKGSDPKGRLRLRPRREADVIARVTGRAGAAPTPLVEGIWRQLMAYGLQAQAKTELVIAASRGREALEKKVRERFGTAAAIHWAPTAALALDEAREREAVAIVDLRAAYLASADEALTIFDVIMGDDDAPLALCVGRVAPEDVVADVETLLSGVPATELRPDWSPASWRERPAVQLPDYPDPAVLQRVERRIAGSQPLASIQDSLHLRAQLAQVAAGRAFLLQGGDCAESFAEFGADKVRTTFNLLLQMGAMIHAEAGMDVVHLARIAGQFAKPRSSPTETVGDVTLPSYRGDAVNGPAFTPEARIPDPKRLLDAHRQAQATVDLLAAYAEASYADLPEINRAARERLGLPRETETGRPVRPVSMFTSHEALLLNYEESLTRFDERSESWWATSGHMIWIGDRTRQLDGAHVEFCRGVANAVGLKCGPSLELDDMLRLMERLDPDNRPGRLVLIGRFGAAKVGDHLARLMQATRREGRNAIWSIDPMHGNTRSVGAHKTRLLADIVAEVETFFAVARAEGVHPGGIHLEMTGADVTECLGGSRALREEDLPRNYLTHCDPRLNQAQALDVAAAVARLMAAPAGASAHAA